MDTLHKYIINLLYTIVTLVCYKEKRMKEPSSKMIRILGTTNWTKEMKTSK